MGRIYHAVIPTSRGLRRAPTRQPWHVNYPAGARFWGWVWEELGLPHKHVDQRIGGYAEVPHIIAGRAFIMARAALSADKDTPVARLFLTRNAVAVVSDYVDLRGATVKDLEAGNARTR